MNNPYSADVVEAMKQQIVIESRHILEAIHKQA